MTGIGTMKELGIFIAYILRHHPESVGITLDEHGWADADALIDGVRKSGRAIDRSTLERIVETDGKMRFAFDADKSKIRANQGHSFPVDVEMTECAPPAVLYHGTAEKYVQSIREKGIIKKTRNFVHLSKDVATAEKVGARHGEPVIFEIAAARMYADGHKFFVSANGVWQTEYVPVRYITQLPDRTL